MNRNGAYASPGSASAILSTKSVSLSIEQTFTFVFLYSIIMAATVSLGRNICSIFLLCMETNALEKSTNNCVAARFFVLFFCFLPEPHIKFDR